MRAAAAGWRALVGPGVACTALAASPAFLSACESRSPAGPAIEPLGQPPVVLVLFDALHAAHLTHLGYERATTPELDRLAAEGVSFSRAFAPAPYTVAGVPSILTGRLPDTHGVTNQAARLDDEEVTLAEYLGAAGYRTAGAVSNLNGGLRLGNGQGFEVFEELYYIDDAERAEGRVEGRPVRLVTADLLVDFAARALATTDPRPLLLYLHVLEPHAPYVMPDAYRELWLEPGYDGVFAAGDTAALIAANAPGAAITRRDVEAAIALYDANLRYADEAFGRIRGLLEGAGLWDPALVLVTSDHGEAFWQHGRWGHNEHLYDEELRVPLIVKLPAGRGLAGLVRPELVSTVDLVPSVCQWLDLPLAGPDLDGRSLAALVEHRDFEPGPRELLLRSHHTIAHLALRTNASKTIVERAQTAEDGGFGRTVAIEHYELDRDPGEREDVHERERERLGPVVERLEAWGRDAVIARNDQGAGMTRTELHMLKELGYVDAIPPREISFDERVRRAEALGFPELAEELTPESTPEEWRAAIERARARRGGAGSSEN